MKTLFFECSMGAAGDMLTAALLDLLEENEQQDIIDKLKSLGLDGVSVSAESAVKCGITGKHVTVKIHGDEEHSHDHHEHGHDHHHEHEHRHDYHHEHEHSHNHAHHHDHGHSHHHSSLHDIEHIINGLPVSEKVKEDALNVYTLIAEAESHAHGKEITEIHFHEVGTKDAIMDVVAVCLLMEKIAPDKVCASPVHVGSGHVHCAHGILPVPAPATAHILTGVPTYSTGLKGELCTPTGAALLKYFVDEFGNMPLMTVNKTGYGMGNKDFEVANCVRVMLGTAGGNEDYRDNIVELVCNIDDMSGEAIGYALEVFMTEGALDAYAIATVTKKSRPGHMITVLCKEENEKEMVQLMLKHTTTIGVRKRSCERYILKRHEETIDTKYGPVRRKISEGYGVKKEKLEHDDLVAIAKANDLSVAEVLKHISE